MRLLKLCRPAIHEHARIGKRRPSKLNLFNAKMKNARSLCALDDINPINPLAPVAAITVANISKLKVRAEINERAIANVKLSQRVNIISEFDKTLQ
jgi:hypothetical protein